MRKIKFIFVHCTATAQTASVQQILRIFKARGWKNPGYHYLVDKDGGIHGIHPEARVSNGVKGYNSVSINVAYIGGIDAQGRGIDNRTEAQKSSLVKLLRLLHQRYPEARILGHRDVSPDKNGNGKVDKWERIKECPCFDAIPEYKWITDLK